MYVWEILFGLCCWFWNPDVMLTPVSRIPSLSHATYFTSLWSLNIAMCMFAHLQVASIDRRAENMNIFPCSLWLSLIHAWLTWIHTYLHLMNTEVSCAEWRRGHRRRSGVSCVAVCCVEIRCLSGPVTVYNIILGDVEEITFLFHCCHLGVGRRSTGWHLFFFMVSNAARGFNG